jgi:predicted RNA-binding Zn-ribbon protein involved in translation (DUF1610 family)
MSLSFAECPYCKECPTGFMNTNVVFKCPACGLLSCDDCARDQSNLMYYKCPKRSCQWDTWNKVDCSVGHVLGRTR